MTTKHRRHEKILATIIRNRLDGAADTFGLFELYYWRLRRAAGLAGVRGEAFEITTAMADKLGRICRLVKHHQRKDPVPRTKESLEECIAGVIIYMEMLASLYELNVPDGFRRELKRAIHQHAK